MTKKAEFNAEEWSVVVGAPLLAAMRVIASERGGTMRETVAVARAYAEAREAKNGEFMSAVLATPPANDAASGARSAKDLPEVAPTTLRKAVSIVERVCTDDELVEYKRLVYSFAETAANAHKEGGFLGIGGTQVSEAEQAALDEIAAIFDEEPST